MLLCVYRRADRALVPLVPIALATGWSALVLFALRIPLNPMSATLGALVIAISTEFAVLLAARFREERAAGCDPGEALRRTYGSTGAAVAASGVTAIAGFAVLAASEVRMLQEFGIVCVVDLSLSLLGVLAVLPAVLVLAERRAARVPAPAQPPAVRGVTAEPPLVAVAVHPLVAAEHPGLRVWTARVAARPGRTPPELRARLRMLADRFRGADAIALRTRPVPSAYRVLFRHLGLDPDVTRTPVEALALERLLRGGLAPRGLPEDALALATLETGVPVWACDAGAVGPELELRPGDDGRLVLADAAGTVAVLFSPPAPERAPGRATTALLLIAVQAPGVADLYVEEAVWTTIDALS